jgi:hypothetical protein
MIKHPASHVDHGLTAAQLQYVLDRFTDRDGFFIETLTLPAELGTVPCGLYGPIRGDSPITEVEIAPRGARAWLSRLVDLPLRQQHEVTVIAGPHEETCPTCGGQIIGLVDREPDPHPILAASHGPFVGCDHCGGSGKIQHACILYTAFGGPLAPQEPGDPGCKDPEASAAFWREHALSK